MRTVWRAVFHGLARNLPVATLIVGLVMGISLGAVATVGGLFVDESGNVGIGTTTPSAALEVVGDLNVSSKLYFYKLIGADIYSISVATDTLSATRNISAAGDITAKGNISGTGFVHAAYNNKTYSATPLECQKVCQKLGGRMATVSEMYAYASSGQNECAYMWVLDDTDITSSKQGVAKGYPMFESQKKTNCGKAGTGDIPRLEGLTLGLSWTSPSYDKKANKADCGCYMIR